jgi:LPXTG-motif cell wall-anchored protein
MQIFSSNDKLLSSTPLFAVRTVEPTLRYRARLIWKKAQKGVLENITLVLAAGGILVLGGTFYYSHRRRKSAIKS